MGYSSYTGDAAKALHDTTSARSTKDPSTYFKAPVGHAIDRSSLAKEVDPFGVVVREARDSDAHPNSVGVIVGFDTTGSMQTQPVIFATKALPKLMGKLVHDGVLEDASVLFASFNDGYTSAHPIQVGQFESGLEMDDDLTRLPLQSGGGGTLEESSEMLLYWAARHTAMDCLEKRNKKGYLFIITDEKPYPIVSSRMVADSIGDTLQSDIRTEDIVAEAQQKFHVFCVLGDPSYHGFRAAEVKSRWIGLLGKDYVLDMQSAEGAADLIADTIRAYEKQPVPVAP